MSASATLLLLSLAGGLLFASLRRVPEGMAFTVHRRGSYARTLGSGVHWIVPLIETVAHRISLGGRSLAIVDAAGRPDDPTARVAGRLFFQVIDAGRADAAIDHLDATLLETAEAVLAELAPCYDQLNDAEYNRAVKQAMNLRLAALGVVVTRTQLARQAVVRAA